MGAGRLWLAAQFPAPLKDCAVPRAPGWVRGGGVCWARVRLGWVRGSSRPWVGEGRPGVLGAGWFELGARFLAPLERVGEGRPGVLGAGSFGLSARFLAPLKAKGQGRSPAFQGRGELRGQPQLTRTRTRTRTPKRRSPARHSRGAVTLTPSRPPTPVRGGGPGGPGGRSTSPGPCRSPVCGVARPGPPFPRPRP